MQQARERIVRVRANRAVKLEEWEATLDFSREVAPVDLRPRADLQVDLDAWAPALTSLSSIIPDEPMICGHQLTLFAEATNEWSVTSEGTRIRQPREHLRLSVQARVKADDGIELALYRWSDVQAPSSLPDRDELRRWVEALRRDALALRDAPAGEPWSGPVLLRGRAAGVFVHEVIGHRVEGQRQKDEEEGQTSKDLVGIRVTAPSISFIDDPTLATYAGFDLNGHSAYDQEGVAAQRWWKTAYFVGS
ncbi:MAG: TldD protein [Myxococcota bacterium]